MVGTLSMSLQCICSVPAQYTTPCPQCLGLVLDSGTFGTPLRLLFNGFHFLGPYSLSWFCRYPGFCWPFTAVLALLAIYFVSPLANTPFHFAVSHPLPPRVARAAKFFTFLISLVPWLPLDKCLSHSLMFQVHSVSCTVFRSVLSRFHQNFFRLLCFSSFSFGLAFVRFRSLVWFRFSVWSCFFVQSRFFFSVLLCFGLAFSTEGGRYLKPRGGVTSHPMLLLKSTVQQPASHHPHHTKLPVSPVTSCLAPSRWIRDLLSSSPDPNSLNDFAMTTLVSSLAITPPMCQDNFPTKQHCFGIFATTRGPQCPDHGSLLPQSPGRIRVFCRSDYDGSSRNLEASGPHRDIISDNRLLTRVLGPKSREDGSTSGEEFSTSCYDLGFQVSRFKKALTNQGWLESEVPRR